MKQLLHDDENWFCFSCVYYHISHALCDACFTSVLCEEQYKLTIQKLVQNDW